MSQQTALPDITRHTFADNALPLQWVGMEKIAVPLNLVRDDNRLQSLAASADIYVSLDNPEAKGIHMSRLYSIVNQLAEREFDQAACNTLLDEMVRSQQGESHNAKIRLAFDLLLQKPALLSGETGYQTYPVVIHGESLAGIHHYEIELSIPYSSTCPCSAALARQLYANAIDQQFPDSMLDKQALLAWVQSEAGSVATPHSQRSYAYIKITPNKGTWPALADLIFQLEAIISTPVQTAVKRSDEQEFARLNAKNLMFCEDAARRVKQHLLALPFISDYTLKIEHQESLHAHNAVVLDQHTANFSE